MNRSLGGADVTIPPAERRAYGPFDEHVRYSDGRHVEGFHADDQGEFVTGPPLREFRRLANNLTVETRNAVAAAERSSDRQDGGDRSLGDLRRFARRASDLSRSSEADSLERREVGPVVSDLMYDARQNDHRVAEGDLNPRIEWAASIRILEQMSSIVQHQ
jgi:hypothetical protein